MTKKQQIEIESIIDWWANRHTGEYVNSVKDTKLKQNLPSYLMPLSDEIMSIFSKYVLFKPKLHHKEFYYAPIINPLGNYTKEIITYNNFWTVATNKLDFCISFFVYDYTVVYAEHKVFSTCQMESNKEQCIKNMHLCHDQEYRHQLRLRNKSKTKQMLQLYGVDRSFELPGQTSMF
jgi:hypothetical protein